VSRSDDVDDFLRPDTLLGVSAISKKPESNAEDIDAHARRSDEISQEGKERLGLTWPKIGEATAAIRSRGDAGLWIRPGHGGRGRWTGGRCRAR